MKLAQPWFAVLLLFTLLISCNHFHNKTVEVNTGFLADSGYIYSDVLLKKIKFDTSDLHFKMINIRKNDTVGKFYKGHNGHYFSCLDASDDYVGCLIVETTEDGTILSKEPYGVGVHDCCWESRYSGFRKYNDYISFRTCTTGTAICGGSISLFKTLRPQDDIGYISESLWYEGAQEIYHDLTSTMSIKNDTVFMHYTNELYKEQDNKKIIENTSQFTIRYINLENKWLALDSSKVSLGL